MSCAFLRPSALRALKQRIATWLLAAAAIALSLEAALAAPTLKAADPDAVARFTQAAPLRLGGRARIDGTGFASGWPGVYAEARFVGQSALIGPISGRSRWRVVVDDVDLGVLNTLVRPVFLIEGLSNQAHTVRLERVDEDRFGVVQVDGVFVSADASAIQPSKPKATKIEFVGDSFMTGFAVSAASFACTDERIWETTDTGLAWPVLVAKALDADYQVNAYSGAGFVRNFIYQKAMPAMPGLYQRAAPAVADPYRRPSAWRPNFIIVGLGENDVEPPFVSTEALPSADAVHKTLVGGIVRFVEALRRANPTAQIVLLDYGHLPTRAAHEAALARLSSKDRSRVSMLTMNRDFGLTGCYSHLDAADHQRVAGRVLQRLRMLGQPNG